MGEIMRHAEVFHNTMEKIGSLRTDEEFTYLELGNFLTDISQFRDPFAHMMAKRTIWREIVQVLWEEIEQRLGGEIVRAFRHPSTGYSGGRPYNSPGNLEGLILGGVGIDDWVNQLMGEYEPSAKRYGKLAQYFEKICLGITHVVFANDIGRRETLRSMLPPQFREMELIPPEEIERIYGRFFTQYYPHEHCDYPPYVMDGQQRARNSMYQRGDRGVIGFVDDYLQFLSEDLSKLELQWKERRRESKTSHGRHDILVSFGKLLHVIEDYFFHSNYTELHLWKAERRRHSSESEEVFKARFARDALRSYRNYPGYDPGYNPPASGADPEAGSHTQWRRRLMRRLRYPLYERSNQLSTSESGSSLEVVYPGGFESTDMLHTMAGALEGLEALLVGFDSFFANQVVPQDLRNCLRLQNLGPLRDSHLVLIRTLFNKDERALMYRDKSHLESQLTSHTQQINSGDYERNIECLQQAGFLNDQAAQALLSAFNIDKAAMNMNSYLPGCSGFLIKLLVKAQKELDDSRRESERLNRDERNVLDERTNNGASGETIGTHTLLSKDTEKSQPLHEDAEILAKFASLAVVQLMLTEIKDNPNILTGLDWDRILKHLIRFPDARNNMWETQALAFFRSRGSNPSYTEVDIQDLPRYPRISIFNSEPIQASSPRTRLRNGQELFPPRPDTLLQRLRNGSKRGELEQRYVRLEERADRFR